MNEFRVLRQFCRSLTTSLFCHLLFLLPWAIPMFGQSQAVSTASTDIPHLIRFSGTVTRASGNPRGDVVGITFALYKEEHGGSPLWLETQNVRPDAMGNYTVQLGANSSEGIPLELFASGEARWLGVRVDGGGEQARVLLLSVPYALKAGDAATVGGLPASAFVLAAPGSDGSASGSSGSSVGTRGSAQPNVGGTGTQNYIPIWTDNSGDLGNSILYQTGSGSSAKVGINLKNPLFTLDVNGQELVRGLFEMATQGYATKTKGFTSQPFNIESSAFNSSTNKYTLNHFQWQAEPTGNNTGTPGATLNLLYGTDPSQPAETGLSLNSQGLFTFAPGQTFPGTGTVTSVGSGAGLTGGPITGSGTLSVANGGVTNTMLQHSSLTVTANSPLIGGGAVSLGGSTSLGLTSSCGSGQILKWNGSSWACAADNNSGGTVTSVGSGLGLTGGPITGSGALSIDPSVVPQLAAANFFSQTNNISVTGSFQDGLDIFDAGSGFGISVLSGYNGIQSQGGAFPIAGIAGTFEGIFGDSDDDSDLIPGVFGFEGGTTHRTLGVLGNSQSPTGAGVYGQIGSGTSGTGSTSGGAGVWGDGGGNLDALGVLATTDNNAAMLVENNTDTYYTFVTFALSSGGYPFRALNGAGNGCYIDSAGSINCTGSKNALVSIDGGQRKVALSAIESPKNWFEDFGSEQLSNGAAVIHLEPEFAQTVNTEVEYHVFLTPNGDCNGLYVTEKSASGFEVHELRGGTSAVKFDYRIVALRKNFENIRMADHTNDPDPMKSVKHLPPAQVDIPKLIPARKITSGARPVQQHANTKAR